MSSNIHKDALYKAMYSADFAFVINHDNKTELVNKYFRQINFVYSVPLALSIGQYYLTSINKNCSFARNLGFLKVFTFGTAIIFHCLSNEELYRKFEYIDVVYPLPTSAQKNDMVNTSIYDSRFNRENIQKSIEKQI